MFNFCDEFRELTKRDGKRTLVANAQCPGDSYELSGSD